MERVKEDCDALILGSGFAGCTSAIYLARYGRSVNVLTGSMPGGQLTITTDVENYPGFENPISGPNLMDAVLNQAKRLGVVFEDNSYAKSIHKEKTLNSSIFVVTSSDRVIRAKCVIIATGASAKWLDIPGEQHYLGRGVSGCATCDGFFFKKKDVVVVGGGNTAAQEALHLASLCQKVILVHRRDTLRADLILQKKLFESKNVEIMYNFILQEVCGDGKKVDSVRLANSSNFSEEKMIKTDGVFIAIGHTPNTKFLDGFLQTDQYGYIDTVPGTSRTAIDGIFAAGDVCDRVYKQAVTAAAGGCMAAIDSEKYLSDAF